MLRRILAAALLALTAVPALAQVPSTMAPNTVIGRLGVSAGPPQAIPFTALFNAANVQPKTANLTALLALGSTGFPTRTGTDTWAQRSVAGTANEITVTNGNGVSGNPTISLPSAITLTGKTMTGGTFSSATISSPTVSGGTFTAGAFNGTLGATTPSSVVATTGRFSTNVGIGTLAPATVLHVVSAANDGIRVTDGTYQGFLGASSFGGVGLIAQSNHPLVFGTNDTERMRISNSGAVGIGTNAPTAQLHIVTTTNDGIRITDGTNTGLLAPSGMGGISLYTLSNHSLNFGTNNSQRMIIDNAGKVGIGTASPAVGFHVASSGIRFDGITGHGTAGCLGNDTSGNITAGQACSGTGFPSSGVKGDLPYYSAAGTGAATTASDANAVIQGADPSGGSTATAAVVLAYGYSKRVVLPPQSGGTTGTYKFSTNLTFPAGTELIIPCGVKLSPDGGVTVRNNGVTKGGQCQIATGSGTVYLGRDVRADWWPSTGSDDALAINAADASTTDAATQGADGTESIIRLSCKAYTAKTAIILNASLTNPQKLIGCGADVSVITGADAGSFSTGAILTQNGQTAGGGNDLMTFEWKDFAVACEVANKDLTAVRLGVTGKAIRAYTKNEIKRVRISECRRGLAFYNTRKVTLTDLYISVHGETTNTDSPLLFDHVDDSQFNGDSDINGGEFVCSSTPQTGGTGYGVRIKSERIGSNNSGIRFHGSVFYYCNKMVYGTWANGGTMGDHWFTGGVQCESCGNIADYGYGSSSAASASFTGAISGTTLTISAIASGAFLSGPVYTVLGSGVTAGTVITNLNTCAGASPTLPCTATVNNSQTVGSEAMTAARSHSAAMLRFEDIYLTGSGTGQPTFRFVGYGAVDASNNGYEVVDLLVHGVRARGGGGCSTCRFIDAEYGAIFNIAQNQMISFEGSGGNPNELVNLYAWRKATVTGNSADPDGISGGVNYLVTSSSANTDDISVVGNNVRQAVSNIFSASAGATNRCVQNNVPNNTTSC